MKNMKKFFTVALAFLMIFQVMGIAASAETADPASVTVSLTSNDCGAAENTVYEVDLHFSETNIGGASGIITYDPAVFTFKEVSMTQAMATANLLADADESGVTTAGDVIKVEHGKVTFAMLANAAAEAGEKWMTLRFTANEVADSAVVDTAFTLSDVKVANATGTVEIPSTTADLTDVLVSDTALKMEGSTIRTNGAYDLRYEITLPQAFVGLENVTEVGVILVPTTYVLAGTELQNDPTGVSFCRTNNSGVQVTPNIGTISMDAIKADQEEGATDYKIYANIAGSSASYMTRLYSLRAFAVMEIDGTEYTVYADNEDTNIVDGTASRSCKGTAIALYEDYKGQGATYAQEIVDIIEKTTAWTAADYAAVVEANCNALASLG